MTALVLDAGALIAVEQGNRAMLADLRVAQRHGVALRTPATVIAQVWRDGDGRQAALARLLRAVDVRSIDDRLGRDAGVLLGRSGTSDVIDATVVAIAETGDRILTSDPSDIARLAESAGRRLVVVGC